MMAAIISAWILGMLLVGGLLGRGLAWRRDAPLVVTGGLLVGLGVSSVVFFFVSLVSPHPARWCGVIEVLLGLAALAWAIRARRGLGAEKHPPVVAAWGWIDLLLAAALLQALVVAVVISGRMYQAEPYGGWDGWAIWNLQARFMLRAGPDWPALLSAPPLNWTHPDYPRLVPGAVARAWAWQGEESPAASALVSGCFAFGVVGVLVAGVGRLRGHRAGLVAGVIALATPFLVTFSSNQHADLPLAGYILAAVLCSAVASREPDAAAGWWSLAGLCAGLGAWTKNEGLLFLVIAALTAGVGAARTGRPRFLLPLGLGAVVGWVPLILFKVAFAPPNDLMAAPLGPRLAQLVDVARHAEILRALVRDVVGFGEWTLIPYLAMALPFFAWPRRRRPEGAERLIWPVAGLMLAGYYATYLLSPLDLRWHLDTSLVRLLLQLWPLVIAGWALALPDPEETTRPNVTAPQALGFWAGQGVIALGLGLALASQLAPGELALLRRGTGTVTAALGEGWYPPEQHGRERWAWAAGRAVVDVSATTDAATSATLRFRLRAVGSRKVVIRFAGRELWQGTVAEQFVRVELPDVTLPAGVQPLEFITDQPGVPERPDGGGRGLAYALYDFELR